MHAHEEAMIDRYVMLDRLAIAQDVRTSFVRGSLTFGSSMNATQQAALLGATQARNYWIRFFVLGES
jgi:hypothetical protein